MGDDSEVANLRKCSVCGGSFPDRDLIQYNDVQVCPSCRPAFFQKLKENSTGFSNCSVCKTAHADSELIQYNDLKICASCKPAFFQKLKEGAALPADRSYAGFWRRGAALFVDGIIFWILSFCMYLAAGISFLALERTPEEAKTVMIITAIQYLIWFAYQVYFIGKHGATPGKMALGVKVINADGSRVSYLKAFGRIFATGLSSIILGIGFLMAAFDDEKRALHDRICNTRVIRTKN